MTTRLLGVETEYACALKRGSTRRSDRPVMRLVALAEELLPCLPGGEAGVFLANGSRLYIDSGGHPELATAECTHPTELVRHIKAGDRIVGRLADELARRTRGVDACIYRTNVDYSGHGTTWGMHESYSHCSNTATLAPNLIPHLVSRVIYTGSGGFNPRAPGLEFTLSPRAWYLTAAVSDSSTHDRGIYHTKHEPLCGGGIRRLHLICGDRSCSDTALWLGAATTALVVALTEAGGAPGASLKLVDAPRALRTFASDPSLKARVAVAGGTSVSALELQRHYLTRVERGLGKSTMPSWAAEACARWRDTLDALERDPASMATTLDWSIKHALYEGQIESHGLTTERLGELNHAMRDLSETIGRLAANAERTQSPMTLDSALVSPSPFGTDSGKIDKRLQAHGLDAASARDFLDVRAELLEIDIRFSQLGPGGLFRQLDQDAVLHHRIPGAENVDEAVEQPPQGSRARIRGEVIRRLSGRGGARSTWDTVFDYTESKLLDLSDPFETTERWKPIASRGRAEQELSILRRSRGSRRLSDLL